MLQIIVILSLSATIFAHAQSHAATEAWVTNRLRIARADMTNHVAGQIAMTLTGAVVEVANNVASQTVAAAIDALPPSTGGDASRLVGTNGWIDGDGGVWQISSGADSNKVVVTFDNVVDLQGRTPPWANPLTLSVPPTRQVQAYLDNWYLFLTVSSISTTDRFLTSDLEEPTVAWVIGAGGQVATNVPLVLTPLGTDGHTGTVTVDWATRSYTNRVGTLVTVAQMESAIDGATSGLSSAWTNSLLYASGGTNYYPRWDSALQTYVVMGVPQ